MLYLIDLFCGAGGVSTGAELAGVSVIACVNHDENAIKSHLANHPKCKHYTEDIRTLNLTELVEAVNAIRANDPNAIIGLWASLECTNFSRAKGGLPRDADSRTLAEHLIESENANHIPEPRYIPLLQPDIIYIENVEEFMSWGPLDKKGKPISKNKGCDYVNWVQRICKQFNYTYDYRILNAADFGAIQSRKRFFAQFAKPHITIQWPKQTHMSVKKVKPEVVQENGLQPHRPVKIALKLQEHGESIFGRKKNLSDKTYERIWHGLVKFVAGGKKQHEQFIARNFTGGGQLSDINDPSGTVMPSPKLNLVTTEPFLMDTQFEPSENRAKSIEEPIGTQTANRKHYYLMNPQYLNKGGSIDQPAFTLIARMDKQPPYLVVTEEGQVAIVVEPTDTPYMVKIKEFMAMYGLIDVKMRMLFIEELLRIQGFPDGYILQGTKAQQKKYIGNAVEVNQATVILRTSMQANIPNQHKAA